MTFRISRICNKLFSFREIKRYQLDKEILRLEIESSELSGTIADRRRAISKSRNHRLLQVDFFSITCNSMDGL